MQGADAKIAAVSSVTSSTENRVRPQFYRLLLVLTFAITCMAPATHAAVFCANSTASMQSALTTSASNGQNDELDIVAGTYLLGAGLVYSSLESNSITVVGGWNAGCNAFTGARSVLDGQNLVRPLFISTTGGSVYVQWLSFSNGLSTNNRGGGLSVNSEAGEIRIDHNRFLLNRADDSGGGLRAYTNSGELRVRGNLFFGNSAAYIGGAELAANGSMAYVIGNTIVGNSSDTASSPGGLFVSGAAHFWISNNILWNNTIGGAEDMHTSAWNAVIYNDIGSRGGTPPDPLNNYSNQSVDPHFTPCSGFFCLSFLSFDLTRASPLVDTGENNPIGGGLAYDLAGKARQIGPNVDIGAFEEDRIFANGFE